MYGAAILKGTVKHPIRSFLAIALMVVACLFRARGDVIVNAVSDTNALRAALQSTNLTVTAVTILNGVDGQFGTFTSFTNPPITIADGIVLSSGEVAAVVPPVDTTLTDPEPNWDMGGYGTAEFDNYGPDHIENFYGSFDVAAVQISFHLDKDSPIKFDFIFGSVEYPYWTSQYTDAMLVFLDGTDPTNQIAFDKNRQPVQVGNSFAGLVATGDRNTAFGSPHGVLLKLTTTSALLPAGDHTLVFEVGDVNDPILDSAAFIANLRAEAGDAGTVPTEPPPSLLVQGCVFQNGTNNVSLTWRDRGVESVLESSQDLMGTWTQVDALWNTNGGWLETTIQSTNTTEFYRLRRQ